MKAATNPAAFACIAVFLLLSGCSINSSGGNLSIQGGTSALPDVLAACGSGPLRIDIQNPSGIPGVSALGKPDAELTLEGWNGDQCKVRLWEYSRSLDDYAYRDSCSFSRTELSQKGVLVLKDAAIRCGYAQESDTLCLAGVNSETNESCRIS